MSLLLAVKGNKINKILDLLQTDYDPNEVDKKTKKSLLHICTENENHEIMELLLNPITIIFN